MKIKSLSTVSIVFMSLVLILGAHASDKTQRPPAVNNVAGTPVYTYLNINNISTVLRNDGVADIDAQEQNSGLVFPKGSRKTAAFQTGFLWGGVINGQIRVGGSSYRTGLQPGKILSPGVSEDPDLPKNRIYRVRRDVFPGGPSASLTSELLDEGGSEDGIRTRYETDWVEWPAADGAPYFDKNNNGIYEPDSGDVPGVPGADQTVWFVCNDNNSGSTANLYGAVPMGIEMQVTAWGYSQQGALGNMIFKKYLLIHKSADTVTNMYLSQWSDIDLGNSTDDYAGCDTTLSLGYVYNGVASDATYDPLPPPATGFDFFQGPVVSSPGDSAIFLGKRVQGKRNLPMTAFYYFARGDATVTDPVLGSYSEGALRFYNFFQGKIGLTGQPFTDPNTGLETPYALAGDPQTRVGWVDGQLLPAGDRRIGLASGPFTMAPGDTQEVVVAELCAGAIPGTDRLSAIGLLKFYDLQAQLAYDNFFDLPTPPPPPKVEVTELDQEILLSWTDSLASAATENSVIKGYAFEGYNVYQLPNASTTRDQISKPIATFDVVNGIGKIKDLFFDAGKGDVLTTVIQFGNDTGIRRYISIKNDEVRGGTHLINGIRYYFAVTAYNYNPSPDAVPNNLENPIAVLTVVPHTLNPGVRLSSETGGTTTVDHPGGIANAVVEVNVVDPTKLIGADYTVGWSTQPDKFTSEYHPPDSALTAGDVTMTGNYELNEAGTQLKYNVRITDVDMLTGPILAAHFHNGAIDSTGPVVRNLSFVFSTVLGKQVATATGTWTSTDAQPLTPALVQELIAGRIYVNVHTAVNPGGEIRMQLGISSYPWYLDRGTARLLSYQQNYSLDNAYAVVDGLQVKVGNLKFDAPITYFSAEQTVDVNTNDNPITLFGDGYDIFGNATGLARDNYGAGGEQTTLVDLVQDLEFRFTGVPSDPNNPLESTIASGGSIATIRSRNSGSAIARVRIPFELWEVENNRQINVTIVDRNAGGGSPWGDTGTPLWYRIRGRDYIIPIATPYDSSTAPAAIRTRTDPYATWFVFFDGGENGNESTWDTGDQFRIVYANPIVPGTDSYSFHAPDAPSYTAATAKQDAEKITVFPNPYYAVNTEELNKYQKFVTFSHLPDNATIRVFNLAGVLVRTIHKTTAGQFQRWDLANESGLPVASGVYIAYIEMPDIGTTKIVKFSIIQERQFLDRF